jgi:hypothetical protein
LHARNGGRVDRQASPSRYARLCAALPSASAEASAELRKLVLLTETLRVLVRSAPQGKP